jgi:alpha-beta hydrolase superfamily lysophospholipase
VDRSSVRRIEGRTGAGDADLFVRAWLPEAPRRALLVVHGLAEHSGRYEAFGAWFAARGNAVHAYDQRGHGRSPGVRGHIDRFDDYLDDLGRVTEHVRRAHPDLPLILVGHSMGGLILAAFLRERKPDAVAAVSSGAALAVAERMPRGRMLIARVLRYLAPRLSFDAGLDPSALSRDPEVGRRYVADPLVFRRISVSLAVALQDAARRTAPGGADVALPMLVLHGEQDALCPVEGSRRFHADLRVHGSALRCYPELRHEIFNEPEAEQVFEDLLRWLESLET